MGLKIIMMAVALLAFASGCVPSLQSKPSDISHLGENQGIVVGSVVINLRKEDAIFPVSLVNRKWHVEIRKMNEGFFTMDMPFTGRALTLRSDGKEVPFVAVLEPGEYVIKQLTGQSIARNAQIPLNTRFTAKEGYKTYIGRLVITIPSEWGNFDDLFFKRRSTNIVVEDAQNETISALSKEYGSSLGDGVQKILMTPPISDLYYTAYRGETEKVAALLAGGSNIEETNRTGWTPLMIAAAEGHLDTVKALLAKGANPNAKNIHGRTALMFAAFYGFTPIAEALIKAGTAVNTVPDDNTRKPALIAAAEKGHHDVAALLLKHGADTTIKDSLGFDALLSAAVAGDAKMTDLLLEAGASPNTYNGKGNAPLLLSISQGHTNVALALLAHGADPNLESKMRNMHATPLMAAASKGDIKVVRDLIARGARLNDKNSEGVSALQYAKDKNHLDVVLVLLEAGAKE